MQSAKVWALAVAALLSAQARAEILDTTNHTLQAIATIAITTPAGTIQTALPTVFPTGYTDWSFSPSPLSANDAAASQLDSVIYDGSSLAAQGAGAASGANASGQPSSGFVIRFTPTVDCTYQLSGHLNGDITSSGYWNSGSVVFTQNPPSSPWSYIIAPTYAPGAFSASGTLYAGDAYQFDLGVWPGTTGVTDTQQGSWDFSLSIEGPSTIPEPRSLLLLAVGLSALAGARRRRLV